MFLFISTYNMSLFIFIYPYILTYFKGIVFIPTYKVMNKTIYTKKLAIGGSPTIQIKTTSVKW